MVKMLKKLAKLVGVLLIIPIAIPIVLVIVPLAMLVILGMYFYSWIWLHWQAWRKGKRFYLVCSSRRGWHEFIVNNLAVALPSGLELIRKDRQQGKWHEMGATSTPGFWHDLGMMLLFMRGNGLQKPYLAEVTLLGIRARSLHERLLSLKPFGHKDSQVQQRLHELLETELGRSSAGNAATS